MEFLVSETDCGKLNQKYNSLGKYQEVYRIDVKAREPGWGYNQGRQDVANDSSRNGQG